MKKFIIESKKGLLLGTVLGLIMMSIFLYALYSTPVPPFPHKKRLTFLFAVIAFYIPILLGGSVSGTIIDGVLIRKYVLRRRYLEMNIKSCIVGSIAGGLVLYPIGILFGISMVGAIGGGIGNQISKICIPVGIGLGNLSSVIFLNILGALIGIWIASIINSAISIARRQFTRL